MITDYEVTFSDQHVLSTDGDSQHIVDLGPLTHGNTTRDIGKGEPMFISLVAQDGFTTGKLTVSVMTGLMDSAVTTTIAQTPEIDCSKALKGQPLFSFPVPTGCERFLKLNYTLNGATGTLWAGIVKDVQMNVSYVSAVEIK